MNIVLERAMALGNGDRKRGETLGTCGGDPAELVAAAQSVVGNTVEQLAGLGVTPAEGVEAVELLTALRNPRLVSFVPEGPDDDAPEPEPDAFDDDVASGSDAFEPESTTKPRTKRKRS